MRNTLDPEIQNRIISNIKYMLERDGMSQSALAIAIDRNVSHLNSILNGRVNPTIEVLINVATFYKITLDELIFTDMAAAKK